MLPSREVPFSHDRPDILWVHPQSQGDDRGSFDDPFLDIATALDNVKEGQTIVLMDGIYSGDLTIERSGTIDFPIMITGDQTGSAIITHGCWFLYDVSDIIISHLTFKESPVGAISFVGTGERNSIHHVNFQDCGKTGKESCTVYFGGSGSSCNTVEACSFMRTQPAIAGAHLSIGIMIAQGDAQDQAPNTSCMIRKNSFVNYGSAIIMGTSIDTDGHYSHIIEGNTIEGCLLDGLNIRCGDTIARGNLIKNCNRSGIFLPSGDSSTIEDNRIIDCATGILVRGIGHTLAENCIVNPAKSGIHVMQAEGESLNHAHNILIENNTMVLSANGDASIGVVVDKSTTAVIRQNIFSGTGIPCQLPTNETGKKVPAFVHENASINNCQEIPGSTKTDISFTAQENGDYSSTSTHGAHGWAAFGGIYAMKDLSAHEFDFDTDEEADLEDDHAKALELDDGDAKKRSTTNIDLLNKSLFWVDEPTTED